MTARLIDGKAIASDLRAATRQRALDYAERTGRMPSLAVVLVGDDPASHVYVGAKLKACAAAAIGSVERRLPASTTQAMLEQVLTALSADPDIDAILLQLPLPAGLDQARAIACIAPEKDVDGLTAVNAGRLALGEPGLRPCTPSGCIVLAERALGDLSGAHCVILGRSILVGKPAALLFLERHCTVTIAHSRSRNLPDLCRSADILVPAIGKPNFVRGDWIKPGACVIDVGINRIEDPINGATRLVGDVDFADAAEIAGAITPVPGGVGPMTIACLMQNAVQAARARAGVAAHA